MKNFDVDFILSMGGNTASVFVSRLVEMKEWESVISFVEKGGVSLGSDFRGLPTPPHNETLHIDDEVLYVANALWNFAPQDVLYRILDISESNDADSGIMFSHKWKGFSPLKRAIKRNDLALVKRVVSHPSFNEKDAVKLSTSWENEMQRTPLELAAMYASEEILAFLLSMECPASLSDWGTPPLALSILADRPVSVLDVLIRNDEDSGWSHSDMACSEQILLPHKFNDAVEYYRIGGGANGISADVSPYVLAYSKGRWDVLDFLSKSCGVRGLVCCSMRNDVRTIGETSASPFGLWTSSTNMPPEDFERILATGGGPEALEKDWLGSLKKDEVIQSLCKGSLGSFEQGTLASDFDRPGSLLLTHLLHFSLCGNHGMTMEKVMCLVNAGARLDKVPRGPLKNPKAMSLIDECELRLRTGLVSSQYKPAKGL